MSNSEELGETTSGEEEVTGNTEENTTKYSTVKDVLDDKSLSDDERIYEVVKTFGLTVGERRIYENEVSDYNYFVIRRAMLRKTSESAYVRQIEIVYVFDGEQSITDFDIINTLERIPRFKICKNGAR